MPEPTPSPRSGPGAADQTTAHTAHAVSRWPTVVRVLVLLGAPPAEARRLAVEAVARVLDAPEDRYGPWDPDTALFAEVLGAWEDDRRPWWRGAISPPDDARTSGDPGDLEALDALDALDPTARARLVLTAVAGLTPEQVEAIVGDDGAAGGAGVAAPPAELGPAAALLAASVDPGAADLDRVEVVARERRRRRRTTVGAGVAAVAAAVALLAGAAVVLVDPADAPVAEPAGARAVLPVVTVQVGPARPVPWYDGRSVRMGASTVDVAGLRSMTVVEDGVAGLLADGSVVVVRPNGVRPLGRAGGDSPVVGSADSPGVAWIDADGALVVARVPPTVVRDDLPAGARLVGRAGNDTYLAVGDDHLVVPDHGTTRRVPGPVPAAVALGTRRSLDGRYELVGAASSGTPGASGETPPGVDVNDVVSGRAVPLLRPDGEVVDAAFGQPGIVTLVLAGRDEGHYDVVNCRLVEGICLSAAEVNGAATPPLLAH